jgi:hypothetical protein
LGAEQHAQDRRFSRRFLLAGLRGLDIRPDRAHYRSDADMPALGAAGDGRAANRIVSAPQYGALAIKDVSHFIPDYPWQALPYSKRPDG